VAVVAGVVVVAVLVVGAVVGWRLITDDQTYDPRTPLADQCDQVPEDAQRITVSRDDGMTLGGALVGPQDAEVGVVLRQGAGQTICDWLPWAGEVADATGAGVLLFDRRGRGSSPGEADLAAEPGDLAAAVDVLRRGGTHRVAVVGSSMGNSVTFAALGDLASPPCALVAISPVLVASDSRGTVDGRGGGPYPPNIWVTWEEQNPSIVANADLIRSRARDRHLPLPHLHGVDTSDHSIRLVQNHDDVRAFVIEAIRSCSEAR
jgi:pimeloyl-ACP methyl ester carboxylesterase